MLHLGRRRRFTALLLAVVVVLLYETTRDSGRCSPWRWRDVYVDEETYAAAAEYRSTTTFRMPSILQKTSGRDGLAFPGFVLVVDEHADDPSLLAHETAHLHQMRRDGLGPYFTRYVSDFARGLWHGCDVHASYMAVGYERLAHITGNVVGNRERQGVVSRSARQTDGTGQVGGSPQR
jgi:hypothetical protein